MADLERLRAFFVIDDAQYNKLKEDAENKFSGKPYDKAIGIE